MEFDPMEAARAQERERDQQQQQQQQRQAQQQRQTDAMKQSSSEMQRQLETQRQQAFENERQRQDQRKGDDSRKQADLLADQQKKRQAQERNRNEALRRQPRNDVGPTKSPQPVASKNAAMPPGPAPMVPELKPGAALQQASKDEQVAEASRAGVAKVLAEKGISKPEKPVSAADARHLMEVAGKLGIARHDPSQPARHCRQPKKKLLGLSASPSAWAAGPAR